MLWLGKTPTHRISDRVYFFIQAQILFVRIFMQLFVYNIQITYWIYCNQVPILRGNIGCHGIKCHRNMYFVDAVILGASDAMQMTHYKLTIIIIN